MFSPLLIKIGFATISSVGVAVGGYFVYKKTNSKKEKEVVIKPSVEEVQSSVASPVGETIRKNSSDV